VHGFRLGVIAAHIQDHVVDADPFGVDELAAGA